MRRLFLNMNEKLAIKEFRDRVAGLLGDGLKRMVLFGSKVNGHATSESDIDILVLVKDSALRRRDSILDQAFEVNLKYGVYVSPRIVSLATFNHPVWRITPFLKKLRKEGVPL